MKGRELKYLIREAGYTQNDVAEFLKISRVHAGRLLSDEIEVDEFYQSKILKFIKKDMFHNVSFDTHVSEPENKYNTPPKPTNPRGDNPPTITLHEHNRILEQKDKLIDQLQDTIASLTELLKATKANPPDPVVQRSGQKTHTG